MLTRFHKSIEIENECFEVLGALFKFPDFLVAASLIVEHADYDVLVDRLPATSRIL